MDRARGPDEPPERDDYDREGVGQGPEPRLPVGGDERRMHVRAYNHWVSLLNGRAYPAIDELDPAAAGDIGPHGVLLDFSDGAAEPRVRFIGQAVRAECGVTSGIRRIADVPQATLLARLTEQYPRILASRAPIGFEAEFVSQRGHPTLYRGILMPFSSDQQRINFIYGVINWKEIADAAVHAQLAAEMADARSDDPPHPAPVAPAWADGPSAGLEDTAALFAVDPAADVLRTAAPLATLALDTGGEAFVLLLARAAGNGHVEVVAQVPADDALLAQAIRRIA
jgi:hypothetical protein